MTKNNFGTNGYVVLTFMDSNNQLEKHIINIFIDLCLNS